MKKIRNCFKSVYFIQEYSMLLNKMGITGSSTPDFVSKFAGLLKLEFSFKAGVDVKEAWQPQNVIGNENI